jgi:hypothetical protein
MATWEQQSELTRGLSLMRSIEHDHLPVAILFDGTDGQVESARARRRGQAPRDHQTESQR